MLPTPLLVLLGAAGGAFLLHQLQSNKKAADEREMARQAALGKQASELEQGKFYAVQLMVTSAINTRNPDTAAATIKSNMESLGWKVLSAPAVRGPSAATAFSTGQPSEWIFTGQWTRPDKFMNVVPPWQGSAMAFQLPVS